MRDDKPDDLTPPKGPAAAPVTGKDIGGVGGSTAAGGGLGTGDSRGNAAGTGVAGGAATGEGLNDIGVGAGDLGSDAAPDPDAPDVSGARGQTAPPIGPGASGQRA